MNKAIKIVLFGLVAFCGCATAQEKKCVVLKDWLKDQGFKGKMIQTYKKIVEVSSSVSEQEKKRVYNDAFYSSLKDKDYKGMMHQLRSAAFLCAVHDCAKASYCKYEKIRKCFGVLNWATGVGALASLLFARTTQQRLTLAGGCALGLCISFYIKLCLHYDLVNNTSCTKFNNLYKRKPTPALIESVQGTLSQKTRAFLSRLFWFIPGDLNLPDYVTCCKVIYDNNNGFDGPIRGKIVYDAERAPVYERFLELNEKEKIIFQPLRSLTGPMADFLSNNIDKRSGERSVNFGSIGSGIMTPSTIKVDEENNLRGSINEFYVEMKKKILPCMVKIAEPYQWAPEKFMVKVKHCIGSEDDCTDPWASK